MILGDEIFTVKSIKTRGLNDLDVLGFGNKFTEYLLEITDAHMSDVSGENDERIKLFSFGKKPTLGDLIKQIVEPEGLKDLNDVKDDLFSIYGIDVNKAVIIRSVRNTTLKYEESIEKIYVSNEDMRRYANGGKYN